MIEHIEPVTHADRHMTERQKAADAAADSVGFLAADFIAAVKAGPNALISTRGWGAHKSTSRLYEVFADSFAGTDGDDLLKRLISVFGKAVREGDKEAVELAKAFAKGYANFHAGE